MPRNRPLIIGVSALAPLALGAVISIAAEPTAPTDQLIIEAPSARILELAAQSKLEPGEESPGGGATTRRSRVNRDAFSQPSQGISFENEGRFRIGNSIFRKLWVTPPASTDSSDGLGPLYNARGCQNCHLKDGRGTPPTANFPDDTAVSMFLRLSIPPETDEHKRLLAERRINVIPEPTYGAQLQNHSVQGVPIEGHMRIDYTDIPVQLADGTTVSLREPKYSVTDLGYGPLHPKTMLSPRVAPQMIGLGLLEAIPESSIRAAADPDDKNGDGISGRVNEVWSHEHGKPMLGRFGWKSGNATVAQQSAEAFSGDIGISNPLFPAGHGECTSEQKVCVDAPHGDSPRQDGHEIGRELFDLVVFYSQNLAVPPRRRPDDPPTLAGKTLFNSTGCASCHTPSHTTGSVPGQLHLSNQKIWPYTDLLLHDMGDGLADNRPEGEASGREWRTPPLWGLGLTGAVSRNTNFLHDGRARTIEEAILWHGGEAQKSRDAYADLSREERDALLAFVKSL
ncbi:MAG: thiol oxidoreductase [Hyphomicrobium sp.]|nr:thiol oxidoreductase [Hyphomicrobium sp.]PPD09139.1 MAG: thiol oxidoreductase [Hyphomicrobium sp.]